MVNSDAEDKLKSEILDKLSPLILYIGAPEDLKCFFVCLDTLKDLINISALDADDAEVMQITKNLELISWAHSHKKDILRLFPLSQPLSSTSFHNYIETYPLASIYFSAPKDAEYYPQWLALLASALSRLIEMMGLSQTNPSKYKSDALQFGRSIRQLTDDKYSKNLDILKLLSSRRRTSAEFVTQLDAVCEKKKYTLQSIGTFKQFYFIRLMLERNPNEKVKVNRTQTKGGLKGNSVVMPGKQPPPERNATDVAYEQFVQEGAAEFKLTQFFKPRTDELERLEMFDSHLTFERIQTATNLKLDLERIDHYYLENRHPQARKRARFAAQAIEMANQDLPFSRSILSGYEINCFLKTLDQIQNNRVTHGPKRQNRPEFWNAKVAAFSGCVFYLSQAPASVATMRATQDGALPNCISWHAESQRVFVPVLNPDHAAPADTARTVPVVNHLELLIPLNLSSLLRGHSPKRRGQTSKGILLFDAHCEQDFIKLLDHINQTHHTDLTPRKIQMTVANGMAMRAPADKVVAVYFRGELPSTHNPAVYSAIPHTRFQKLYDASVMAMPCSDEFKTGFDNQTQASFIHEFETKFVGSLHVPSKSYVKAMLEALRSKYMGLRSSPNRSIGQMHNAYTAWIVIFYLATSGVRSVSNVMPSRFDIDFPTGTAFVSDKDNPEYFHARLVWLCPQLLDQFKRYQAHLDLLRYVLSIDGAATLDKLRATDAPVKLTTAHSADRVADALTLTDIAPYFFFMDPRTNALCDTTPTLLGRHVSADWELRLVSLRHFIRSSLIEAGCSGEVINALLGHHARGESPWGTYSTLPPVVWREKVSEALTPLIASLGLEALDGPLTWGPMA